MLFRQLPWKPILLSVHQCSNERSSRCDTIYNLVFLNVLCPTCNYWLHIPMAKCGFLIENGQILIWLVHVIFNGCYGFLGKLLFGSERASGGLSNSTWSGYLTTTPGSSGLYLDVYLCLCTPLPAAYGHSPSYSIIHPSFSLICPSETKGR